LIATLDKGQRSVKGLASGFENVATLDLMLTLRPASEAATASIVPTADTLEQIVRNLLVQDSTLTPSHLYLELLRVGFRGGWDLSRLDLRSVTELLRSSDRGVDRRSARVSPMSP
jgi:hypothetical protein